MDSLTRDTQILLEFRSGPVVAVRLHQLSNTPPGRIRKKHHRENAASKLGGSTITWELDIDNMTSSSAATLVVGHTSGGLGHSISTATSESAFVASQDQLDSWKDPARFEVFAYSELAERAKKLEHTFDELRGVSSLWFGVDGDEGIPGRSFGGGAGRGGAAMFGDWRLDESMVEEFEDEIEPTRSDKQEILKAVDALLGSCEENGGKERQGLQECVCAFGQAIEGNLTERLDKLTEQCAQRWTDEQETTETAIAGLNEVDARTAARLEALGKVLMGRQESVLADMKREREANKRRILASTSGDPHEDSRMMFNKQLEITMLEGKLKQRQHLLDITSKGAANNQAEIEGAMLKAARDRVENLMHVVDKMQTQQSAMSAHLHAEKRKIASLRLQISARLGTSANETGEMFPAASGKSKSPTASSTPSGRGFADMATAAAAFHPKTGDVDSSRFVGEEMPTKRAEHGENDEEGELDGVELLDACDRLEQDNLRLREKLAKIELQRLQREHQAEEENDVMDSRITKAEAKKKGLEDRLAMLKAEVVDKSRKLKNMRAGRERSIENAAAGRKTSNTNNSVKEYKVLKGQDALEEHAGDMEAEVETLERKMRGLRQQLVFSLACNVMTKRFEEAGMGPADDPNPPPACATVDGGSAEDASVVPRQMQAHAAILRQRFALEEEIKRTAQEEQNIRRTLELATRAQNADNKKERNVEEQPVLDKEGSDPEAIDAAFVCGEGKAQGAETPKARDLKRMVRMAKVKLTALRSLANKNKEAEKGVGELDELDKTSLQEVIKNEAVALETAKAVLEILQSPAMEQARKQRLNEAVSRSLDQKEQPAQPGPEGARRDSAVNDVVAERKESVRNDVSTMAFVTPGGPGDVNRKNDSDFQAEGRKSDVSAKGKHEAADSMKAEDRADHVSDGIAEMTPVAKGQDAACRGTRAPAEGKDDGVDDLADSERRKASNEPAEDATTEVQVNFDQGKRSEGVGNNWRAKVEDAGEKEEGDEEERKEQEQEAEVERERQACADLMAARAKKQIIINDLRAKIKATGDNKPRLSGELRQRELKRAQESVRAREKKVALENKANEPTLEDLPPEMRHEIITLRREDAKLGARLEKCLDVIRTVLRAKGLEPQTSTGDDEASATGSGVPDGMSKPRKLTRAELEKEKFLHSLTPQLERWRARVTAVTQVMADLQEQASREALGTAGEGTHAAPSSREAIDGASYLRPLSPPLVPVARVSLEAKIPEANLPGSAGSGKRDLESKVAIAAASNAVKALATGTTGGHGLRSIGRVVKEANQLRGRVESSERWVIQTSLKEDGSLNPVVNVRVRSPTGSHSPTGSRSPPPRSPLSPRSPNSLLPPAHRKDHMWPPLLSLSLSGKSEAPQDWTGSPPSSGAKAPPHARLVTPSPHPPPPERTQTRTPAPGVRTIGALAGGIRGAPSDRAQSPSSLGQPTTSRPSYSDRPSTATHPTMVPGETLGIRISLEGQPSRSFSAPRLQPSTSLPCGHLLHEDYADRRQTDTSAPIKSTAEVFGGVTPGQLSARSGRASPLYHISGEKTHADGYRSPRQSRTPHRSPKSAGRSQSPLHDASGTANTSSLHQASNTAETSSRNISYSPGSAPVHGESTNSLAAAIVRALGEVSEDGATGRQVSESLEACRNHPVSVDSEKERSPEDETCAALLSGGAATHNSEPVARLSDFLTVSATSSCPKAGERRDVLYGVGSESTCARRSYEVAKERPLIASVPEVNHKREPSPERHESKTLVDSDGNVSEPERSAGTRASSMRLHGEDGIVRDGRVRRLRQTPMQLEIPSTSATKTVYLGTLAPAFTGTPGVSSVDHSHVDSSNHSKSGSMRSYQRAPVASSSSPSSAMGGLSIRSGSSSVRSLQPQLPLPFRALAVLSVEAPPPGVTKINTAKATPTRCEPNVTSGRFYSPFSSEAKTTRKLSHEGPMTFHRAHIHRQPRLHSGNPSSRRSGQQQQRGGRQDTNPVIISNLPATHSPPLEMLGAKPTGLKTVDIGGSVVATSGLPPAEYSRQRGAKKATSLQRKVVSAHQQSAAGVGSMFVGSLTRPQGDDNDGDKRTPPAAYNDELDLEMDDLGAGLWNESSVSPAILHRRQEGECQSPLPSPKAWTPIAEERPRYIETVTPPEERESIEDGVVDSLSRTEHQEESASTQSSDHMARAVK